MYTVRVYTSEKELPDLLEGNFFHSPALFRVWAHTPACTPYMFVAYREEAVVGQILAVLRRRKGIMLTPLITQGRIYGEGVYRQGEDKQAVFHTLLQAITRTLVRRLCLYIEFSNLSSKMFGYSHFRNTGYFPVRWMHIDNDCSADSDERQSIDARRQQQVDKALQAGVTLCEATTDRQIGQLYDMMRSYYRFKLQRILPRKPFFQQLLNLSAVGDSPCAVGDLPCAVGDLQSPTHHILLTMFREKVIGGSTIVVHGQTAYLWYIAARRRAYVKYHPDTLTVRHAIDWCRQHHISRLNFMNTGMPFRKNTYREFLLSFGGTPTSGYRWFRVSIGWLNKLLKWIYRE